ncbi:MAG: hypothetical protein QM639_06485 [Rhodocyclaceae bacterium]
MAAANDTDDIIISKADALIRRNRSDGVTGDELPLLMDEVDEELPELTDAMDDDVLLSESLDEITLTDTIDLLNDAELPLMSGPPLPQIDLPAVRQAIAGIARPAAPPVTQGLSADQVEILIDDAVQRTRDDMQRQQQRAIEDAVARARADMAAAHQTALEQARAQAAQEAQPSPDTIAQIHRDAQQAAAQQTGEQLIELDAYIAQAIDSWIAQELPQIIATELDSLVERLRIQTAAHMRATLLPEISNKLSGLL